MQHDRPRVMFLDGPGNLVLSYKKWKQGAQYEGELAQTYSAQFFNVMRRWDAQVHAIAWPSGSECIEDGHFKIEHRPQRTESTRGLAYHVAMTKWSAGIMRDAVKFGADLVVLYQDPSPFLFAPLHLMRPKLMVAMHTTFWPTGFPPTGLLSRLMLRADGWFLRNCADATLAISPECERQVRALAGKLRGPVLQYFPRYAKPLRSSFSPAKGPFRVLISSRIERNKGVFDALQVAANLQNTRPGQFHWVFCGTGSALEELRAEVERRGMSEVVELRGHVKSNEMIKEYEAANAVMVPTTSEFAEGMAKVALEGALAGRPVVLSSTVPAGEILGEVAWVVHAGDITGYQRALGRLADDPELCRKMGQEGVRVAQALMANSRSFENQIDRMMDIMFGEPIQGQHPMFAEAEMAADAAMSAEQAEWVGEIALPDESALGEQITISEEIDPSPVSGYWEKRREESAAEKIA